MLSLSNNSYEFILVISRILKAKISPLSRPSFIAIAVTPLKLFLSKIADCIGDAPRYAGKIDA